jgi:hypothetical protein
LNGFIVASRFMSDQAQQVKGIGVVRILAEDLPVQPLRLCESASAVMLHCSIKQLRS